MDNITSLALTLPSGGNKPTAEQDLVTWNSVLRLVVLSIVSTCGSIGGVFIISGVTVADPLQTRGNIFLVNFSLAHLLITGLVLPSSCVAILAGIPQEPAVCSFQWLVTLVCFVVTILSFMFIAMDSFLGLGSLVTYDLCCTKCRIVFSVLFTWTAAVAFASAQHVMNYGPSLCTTDFNVSVPYHASVGVFLVLLPIILSVWYFIRSLFRMKNFKLRQQHMEDPAPYVLTDEHLLKSNILIYAMTLLMWMPLAVVSAISLVRPMKNVITTLWWVAVSNSCVYSYVYAATNKDFRDAFNKLFYYCCCKSHVSFSRRQREARRSVGDGIGLRVHIIPGMNIYAQRKENLKEGGRYSQPKTPYDL